MQCVSYYVTQKVDDSKFYLLSVDKINQQKILAAVLGTLSNQILPKLCTKINFCAVVQLRPAVNKIVIMGLAEP